LKKYKNTTGVHNIVNSCYNSNIEHQHVHCLVQIGCYLFIQSHKVDITQFA